MSDLTLFLWSIFHSYFVNVSCFNIFIIHSWISISELPHLRYLIFTHFDQSNCVLTLHIVKTVLFIKHYKKHNNSVSVMALEVEMLVRLPVRSRLRYHSNHRETFCHERHLWCPEDSSCWLWWSFSTTMRSAFVILCEISQILFILFYFFGRIVHSSFVLLPFGHFKIQECIIAGVLLCMLHVVLRTSH